MRYSNSLLVPEHCPDCGRELAPGEECYCTARYCPECGSNEYWNEDETECYFCGYVEEDEDGDV